MKTRETIPDPNFHDFAADHTLSIAYPEKFWAQQAENLAWTKFPQTILEFTPERPNEWKWFPDGKFSASFNLITRHILAGRGSHPAFIWDSPVTGQKRTITYRELQREVEALAGVLKDLGVRAGQRVVVYMPMILEAVFAMLACTHIGAVHVVVFGGFAPAELRKRIESVKPAVVLTASCGIEGHRKIPYLPLVREAIAGSMFKPLHTLVWQREEHYEMLERALHELPWNSLIRSYKARSGHNGRPPYPQLVRDPDGGVCEVGASMPAGATHYIIHTSGTTGAPKGVVRALSHLVQAHYTRHLFGLAPGKTIFTASDIGWVVGHHYIIYAPLLAGATSILFEGKPTTTPDTSTFFRLIAENGVSTLSTAPSAFRAILSIDPDLSRSIGGRDISSLQRIFLAGERSEPQLISTLQHLLPHTDIIDNWWSTESGSPIAASYPGSGAVPGSAGKLMPGYNLIDNNGRLEFLPPLPPAGIVTVYSAPERFNAYFTQEGHVDTGDLGEIDEEGIITIHGRADDIINVAAHRLSSGGIEEACRSVQGVAEAYVVPAPDLLKGEVPVAFIVLGSDHHDVEKTIKEVKGTVREVVGAIAGLGAVWTIPGTLVPRTRSGKVLRRAFKALTKGEGDAPEGIGSDGWEELKWRVKGDLENRVVGKAKL